LFDSKQAHTRRRTLPPPNAAAADFIFAPPIRTFRVGAPPPPTLKPPARRSRLSDAGAGL